MTEAEKKAKLEKMEKDRQALEDADPDGHPEELETEAEDMPPVDDTPRGEVRRQGQELARHKEAINAVLKVLRKDQGYTKLPENV